MSSPPASRSRRGLSPPTTPLCPARRAAPPPTPPMRESSPSVPTTRSLHALSGNCPSLLSPPSTLVRQTTMSWMLWRLETEAAAVNVCVCVCVFPHQGPAPPVEPLRPAVQTGPRTTRRQTSSASRSPWTAAPTPSLLSAWICSLAPTPPWESSRETSSPSRRNWERASLERYVFWHSLLKTY